jgi:hypothetical protein
MALFYLLLRMNCQYNYTYSMYLNLLLLQGDDVLFAEMHFPIPKLWKLKCSRFWIRIVQNIQMTIRITPGMIAQCIRDGMIRRLFEMEMPSDLSRRSQAEGRVRLTQLNQAAHIQDIALVLGTALPIHLINLNRGFVAVLYPLLRAHELLSSMDERNALARQDDRRSKPVHAAPLLIRMAIRREH